jgi:integrase/recombinase XerD
MSQELTLLPLKLEEQYACLQAYLPRDWTQDRWCLSGITEKGEPMQRQFTFGLVSPGLTLECKYALWYHWTQRNVQQQSASSQRALLRGFRHITTWLNQVAPAFRSLLDRPLEFWMCSLRTWLVQTGHYHTTMRRELTASQTYQEYFAEDRCVNVLRVTYRLLTAAYDQRPEREKDVWDLRKLGVRLNLSQSAYKLNFTLIVQPWLRALAKAYLEYHLAIHSAAACSRKLFALRQFSLFLAQMTPHAQAADLDRALILRYLSFLQGQKLSATGRSKYLSELRTFLETCAHRLHVPGLTREALIFDEDLPQREELGTREIPAEVLVQLRANLNSLPTTPLRMVTVLLEVGLRISELCQLSLDCLICDDKHEWYLRCYQSKTHREHVIPLVDEEVIGAIQAQQQEIRAQWGKECPYLFPAPSSHRSPYRQHTFATQLNKWAVECQILDRNQQLYRFTSHQFRHTLGMRLLNEDVPLEVVGRLLGHRSLAMTRVYARIRDQKVRADLARVARLRKTVDYQGNAIKGDPRANDLEVQMTRQGMRGQTLPVGGCGRLVVLGECAHANKCLTCPMWLTSTDDLPALKSFYDRAIRLKQRATTCGHRIVIDQQERIIATLTVRIKSLEETPMDGSLCVDDVLAQLRTDLAEAECGLEEAQGASLVLAARHLERAITDMKMRIAALEVPHAPTNE